METITETRIAPGTLIANRYRISNEVGFGSFATVYKGEDTLLGGCPVALKVVHRPDSGTPHDCHQIAREVAAGYKIEHPNIVSLYDCIYDPPFLAFVLEFVDGKQLDLVCETLNVPYPQAVAILLQIAQGLSTLHRKGIVHRDLKPQNIIVSSSGLVKIADLGLVCAQPNSPDGNAILLSNEVGNQFIPVSGTPQYMPPEYLNFGELSTGVDIYAFGLLARQLLSAKLDANSLTKVQSISFLHEVPSDLKRLVERACEPNVEKRLSSIENFVPIFQREIQRLYPASTSDQSTNNTRYCTDIAHLLEGLAKEPVCRPVIGALPNTIDFYIPRSQEGAGKMIAADPSLLTSIVTSLAAKVIGLIAVFAVVSIILFLARDLSETTKKTDGRMTGEAVGLPISELDALGKAERDNYEGARFMVPSRNQNRVRSSTNNENIKPRDPSSKFSSVN